MLRICICDDDAAARAQLEELVGQYFNGRAFLLTTHSGYTDFLTAKQHLDLLLMDIDLGDGSGIELAKGVKYADSSTCVIFVTAHPEYVEESFEAEPVYFLVKPIRSDSFQRAMDARKASWQSPSKIGSVLWRCETLYTLNSAFAVPPSTPGHSLCGPMRSCLASSSG